MTTTTQQQTVDPRTVTLRTTYDEVTPESAKDGDFSDHGWVGADGFTQYPAGDEVGPAIDQPGKPWFEGRAASTVTFTQEPDETLDDFITRAAEDILSRSNGKDHAQGGLESFTVYGHPGEMDFNGVVESRAVHVEADSETVDLLLVALGA